MLLPDELARFDDLDPEDVKFLLCSLLSCSRSELPFRNNLNSYQIDLLRSWLIRLQNGEPPQYITNKAWFYGLELYVDNRVLIPRFDTEPLVEATLKYLKDDAHLLEIGVGSAAISLALKSRKPTIKVTATDISPDVLQVAKQNSLALGLDIDLVLADLFPSRAGVFDVIVSNPPYISDHEYQNLHSRVKDYEPIGALLADHDGMIFYERILAGAPQYLVPGGILALEHGYNQQSQLQSLTESTGFEILQKGEDLAGLDRFLILKLQK
jgi:release factor glutamine methyltransferase